MSNKKQFIQKIFIKIVNKLYYYLRQYNLKLFDYNFINCVINLLKFNLGNSHYKHY